MMVCCIALALQATGLRAQSFVVRAYMPGGTSGAVQLLIFGDGNRQRILQSKVANGMATFEGTVVRPTYAELRHRGLSRPIPLFIENSDITVTVDAERPERSPISGSRSNSEMRYLLETCGADNTGQCLAERLGEMPAAPYAPYLAYRYLADDLEALQRLADSMTPPATQAWHYRELRKRIATLQHLQADSVLPSFSYTDSQGRQCLIDTLLADSCHYLLLFAATWCHECDSIQQRMNSLGPTLQTVRIDIDQQPKGWDAPFMQQLAIDHLPHLMLVNPNRRIANRDIRHWQVKKIINSTF